MSNLQSEWVDIGALADIPLRGARVVKSPAGCIAVFRTADNEAFAIDDKCPHNGGPLSEGIVHGRSVTCPLHNWVIALDTGDRARRRQGAGSHIRAEDPGWPHPAGSPRPSVGESGMTTKAIRTTCPYCGVGCGVLATPTADGGAIIKGDPEHPANFGRLCSKGCALGETLSLDERLLQPLIDGIAREWDSALDTVASKFREAIATHGPDSVAFYVSGQILTEDYYVANKLMKGFIGSANIDTNSRLCMASSVAGHKRAFGSDTVPGCYEDLDQADLVVLVGSNLAWCHPVLFQRIAAAKEARDTKVVVIDPRRTATCELADLHLPIAPGTDVALFNGLLLAIAGANAVDHRFVSQHTNDFTTVIKAACRMPVSEIARTTGLSKSQLHEFFELFVSNERVVTVYSQGVNQSIAGTDKVNAIINCHLATGRIGKPGMGPFSVTGQPNAMGGREVGGLANMLAAHMDLADPEHRRIVQSFWRSPRIADKPGLKAVDLFRAVDDGRIKALWIMATNPVDSMPEADGVRRALAACPFVVVSDVMQHTDTMRYAHVQLPALAWGEKNGTVTNSERRMSRQRPFLPPPGDARADWWQLAEVAKRMGFGPAFSWATAHEIFTEYARLTTMENAGLRDLDLGNLATVDADAYDNLAPVTWPHQRQRLFADGAFYTPDRKARFIATPYRPTAQATDANYPFVLNTGRVRDQWHTMTRTGLTARLMGHIAEPFIEVHPDDAHAHNLATASIARVTSAHASALLRVAISARQRKGSVFAPIHWTDQVSSAGRIDALVGAHVDPVSGQPELKATPVAITPFAANLHAFGVSRARPAIKASDYWALARASRGWQFEIADAIPPDDYDTWARHLLCVAASAEVLSYRDAATGQYRVVAFEDGILTAALFAGAVPVAVSRSWLVDKLGARIEESSVRLALLAGRGGAAMPDKGAIVCACFDIGANEIARRAEGGCQTIAAIGAATKAGTNCGSCRSEIGRIIDGARTSKAG